MKTTSVLKSLLFATITFSTITPLSAQAHYLWIERNGDAAALHFGEYEEGVMERSPGKLDDIRNPSAAAVLAGTEKAVTLNKGSDGFGFAEKNKSAALVARETSMAVRDLGKQGIGLVKPMFYARNAASFTTAAAVLPLDITPDGKPGQFRVWLDGKPLAKATIKIVAPNGWAQEDKSGEDGRLTLAMPWRGQYIIHVIHKEDKAGEFEGAHFDAIRHRTTLTVEQPAGIKTFAQKFQQAAAGMK
jgi:hypothetical protein